MDVSTMTRLGTQISSLQTTNATTQKTNAASQTTQQGGSQVSATGADFTAGGAFSVSISSAGAAAANQNSGEVSDTAKKAAEATKGLTSDQIAVLQDGIDKSYQLMIQTMTSQNARLQAWLDLGIGTLNFGGVKVDAYKFALPEVATTPEDAAKAVADGGAWSVNAVADRIFGLASTIANGDPERLKTMQDAVEKGFQQAGVVWKDTFGQDKMPDITQKTHDEITKRFNNLFDQLKNGNATDAADAAAQQATDKATATASAQA